MEIRAVTHENIEIFSKVLTDAALWLNSVNEPMWKVQDLTVDELLKKYDIEDMKLCYEDGNLIGVYVLQWFDPLFWRNIYRNECGIIHKLAVVREHMKKGYGSKLIESAELICKANRVKYLRLNCGTHRMKLRKFYESNGFVMVDRVFIDNRDQVRYEKLL